MYQKLQYVSSISNQTIIAIYSFPFNANGKAQNNNYNQSSARFGEAYIKRRVPYQMN